MFNAGMMKRNSRVDPILPPVTTMYVCSNALAIRHFKVPCCLVPKMSKHGAIYVERDQCPVYTAIQVIEGRWKPMIVRRLGDASLGFGELRRTMPGITIKVLRQHLRQLEAEGIVTRSAELRPTLRVRYRLTPHGRTLGPVFETLWAWGVTHLARLDGARVDPRKVQGAGEQV
jgi:DNA-binding HxlR family transcriptional regulator